MRKFLYICNMLDYHNTYCKYSIQNIAECNAPDFVLNDSLAATWEHSPANFLSDYIEQKSTLAEAHHKSVSMLQFPLLYKTNPVLAISLLENKRPELLFSSASKTISL